MINEIKYGGFTAQPSDYSCPDGDLALSLNLINEDGGLRPVESPAPAAYLAYGETVLLIHKVTGQENYILLNSDKLYWMKRQPYYTSSKNSKEMDTKGTLSGYKTIAAVGNTLCVSTAKGVDYILWKDGNYKYLGNRPPLIHFSFGCNQIGKLEDEVEVPGEAPQSIQDLLGTKDNPGGMSFGESSQLHFGGDSGKALWKDAIDTGMGTFLSQLAEKVTTKGYFHQPFYVRYAYRLYDGSYSWQSPPVLMLPAVYRPIIYSYCDGKKLKLKLDIPYFSLSYRFFGDLEDLKKWSDIVVGIDFFISAPIYTYGLEPRSDGPSNVYSLFGGYEATRASSDWYFAGIYNGAEHTAADVVTLAMNNWCIDMEVKENFQDQLYSQYLFYKVASIDTNELADYSYVRDLPLDVKDFSAITTLPTLEDDYNSHATIIPEFLYSYNQRLIMNGISIIPPRPFPLAAMAQTITGGEQNQMPTGIKVYTRINGKKCVTEYSAKDSDIAFPIGAARPRYLYHPDPNAYMMEVKTSASTFRFAMKPHPFLSGSYFWGGLDHSSSYGASADDVTNNIGEDYTKIYISQVNNPFLFPVESIVTIDCGRIFRLSTAAKALSQGQFGQFPLYAFTDDGVWALEVASTGVISVRQPITRDVCLGQGAGITQIDSAVLFPTDRGIMLISGSQTQCITDPVNALESLSLGNYKGFFNSFLSSASATSLLPSLTLLPDDDFIQTASMPFADSGTSQPGILEAFPTTVVPFRTYIETCRMAYDYPHQHILVFNPSYGYFYVYSLKSQSWCMAHGRLSYAVNSYPEALIADTSNRLLDFSAITGAFPKGALLSRPLKLDYPNVHKTVSTIIQRGFFRNGKVQCILYGSRDLINWHVVYSSKDHFLRGFSGSPYKYFRIAVGCLLAKDETLYGASVEFEPRYTNQPR